MAGSGKYGLRLRRCGRQVINDPGLMGAPTLEAATDLTVLAEDADLLEAALQFAADGFRVIPLHNPDPDHSSRCSCHRSGCVSVGKHPRTQHGVKHATNDHEAIRGWWSMWPNANIGIATGDGLVVLDVDPRHDGDSSLDDIEAEHGEIVTRVARTGGGGFHLYLQGNLPARGAFRPGLDLKAAGGYVISPPSKHFSGLRYSWVDRGEGIRVVPEWLAKIVKPPRSEKTGAARSHVYNPNAPRPPWYVRAAIISECENLAASSDGDRNNALNRAAYSLSRFVRSGEAQAGPLIEALRISAGHAGLGDHEIDATIESAFRARGVA